MKSGTQRLRNALADALLPPPALLLSEWARRNFRLSSDYSAAKGNFEPYPYQIEPLDVLSPSNPAETMALMCGAQMMKTLLMMILLGYVIDVDPGPVLIVQPTADDARAFSSERVAPMLRDVTCLHGKVHEPKSRDSGNTILQKKFNGGSVSLTGTVSARGLRRRSVRYLLLDEIDGYEDTRDGDPVALAAARTSKFWNRKIVKCSTPTVEGRSRIAAAFEASDQRLYFVPCPFCGHMQTLEWRPSPDSGVRFGHIELPDGTAVDVPPEEAVYQCAECRALIPHHRKLEMLRAGEWRATNPEGKYPGFRINRLYAPDWPWGKVVTDPDEGWLAAQGHPEKLRVFANNMLAETWREPGEAPPDYEVLMGRFEDYHLGQVPLGPLFLTAGVDVQKTWMEGYVWGFGRNRQRWVVDWWRIERPPFGDPLAWEELDAKLYQTYRHPSGAQMSIMRMAIDTGYAGNEVYAFARRHGTGRVLAVDGRDTGRALVDPPTLVDVTVAGRKIKHGCRLWPINVSMAKQELYAELNLARPKPGEPYPSGWIHFPVDLPEEFYRQLTSEEFRLSSRKGGVRKMHWEPIENRRHEALDDANYARAAAFVCGWDRFGERHYRNLEALLNVQPEPELAPAAVDVAVVAEPERPAAPPPPVARPAANPILRPARRIIRSAYLSNRGY
jgi:phage terminase large subunit GpA-like protein